MKKYEIVKISDMWSTNNLRLKTEALVNEKSNEGYEIISVAFGVNVWWMPTAYITICK